MGSFFFCFAAFACGQGGGWFDMQAAANENRKKGKKKKKQAREMKNVSLIVNVAVNITLL